MRHAQPGRLAAFGGNPAHHRAHIRASFGAYGQSCDRGQTRHKAALRMNWQQVYLRFHLCNTTTTTTLLRSLAATLKNELGPVPPLMFVDIKRSEVRILAETLAGPCGGRRSRAWRMVLERRSLPAAPALDCQIVPRMRGLEAGSRAR